MIGGPQQDFAVVPFREAEAASYPELLEKQVAQMAQADGCVIFCDLVGGTPFNQSMLAAMNWTNVRVVAGVNLPMLLECCAGRMDQMTADQLAEMAVEIGRMGVESRQLVHDDGCQDVDDSSDEAGLDEGEGI